MKGKKLVAIVVGVVALAGVVASIPLVRAQETTRVVLTPLEVGVAETAQLEGRIVCPANNCGGLNLTLRFDRDKVRVRSVQPGPFFGENVFLGESAVDNARGEVRLIAAALSPPTGASDVLFTLEVEGLVVGAADFHFEALKLTDLSGNPLEAEGEGTTVTVVETGKIPFFSPPEAGCEVVFTSERDGNPEIYVVQADGSNPRRLTDHPSADTHPTWSPSGARIAFVSERDGNPEIYTMDAAGGDLRRLTDDPSADTYPAWSPSGAHIAFVSERDGNPEIYVMRADGSELQRLTDNPATDTAPVWSADGNTIAFVSDRDGVQALYFMDADGANVRQVLTLAEGAAWYPAWSPNGAWLSVTGGQAGAAQLYRLESSGANPTPLTDPNLSLTTSDWSPDSAWLAFATRGEGGSDDLFVIDAEGRYRFRLTQHPAPDYDPDWRPTGGACLARVAADEEVFIYVGPGRHRGVFGLLPPGQSFTVVGQAQDAEGRLWWKLDKSQIQGGDMALSLWVAAEDVAELGACEGVPVAETPPVIVRFTPTPPNNDWGDCGSCQTCGHPANECVLSPSGQCLWDPRHCTQTEERCYVLSPSAVGPGIVSVQTPQNCQGGYRPGTAVTVVGIPTSITHQGTLDHWGGTCTGATGSANPITVTVNAHCTVIGYFR